MRKVPVLVLVVAALLALSAPALAGGKPMATSLTPREEVDPVTGALGAGDPDASGFARFTLNQGQGEICVESTVSNTSRLVGAHIHRGPARTNGPVVVHFTQFINGLTINGCTSVDRALVKEIRKNPQAFYFNVHSTEKPAGAVRGQLGD